MNKLTDSEIVEALECCNGRGCEHCPIGGKDCIHRCRNEAIDLINRQKAEIERLQKRQKTVVAENAITALREKCIEHQDFHKGDDGVFRAYVSIEDLDQVIDELEIRS